MTNNFKDFDPHHLKEKKYFFRIKVFESHYFKIIIEHLFPWASIYWKDKAGAYLGCNNFQAKMANFDHPSDIIGKTDYDLPWHEIANILYATDQRIIKTGISEELIEQATLPDGTQFIMLTNKTPLYDDEGQIIGIIGTSLNITALKKAEEREKIALADAAAIEIKRKAEEEIKRIVMIQAGSIAHDLRTPLFCLNSIGFSLESVLPVLLKCYHLVQQHGLPLSQPLSPKDKECIENILDIPKKLEAMIDNMQVFITDNLKAIKRSTSPEFHEEDLVTCVSYKGINNALDAYPFKSGERQRIHWDRSYYFSFLGNPVLFLRILFNLLNNSLYQIDKNGQGEIFITSQEQPDKNIIRFRDTGGGAPQEIVDRIFQGYTTTKQEGTGVGLAFCKLTMESFGGDITCHSSDDSIEFVLSFPKIPS